MTDCIERIKKYHDKYRKNNSDKRNEYIRNRQMNDIQFKIATNLRKCLNRALKIGQKSGSAVSALQCSISELKLYLEDQFYPNPRTGENMTWENYGLHGWHIDHIKPLSSFDLTDVNQFLEACCYTNLQPLWAEHNLKKGAKYETNKQKS